jgi:hypothetical protein
MASSFLRGSEVRQPTQDFRLGGDGGVRLTMLDRRSSANHQRWHIVRRCIKTGWTSGCLAIKLGSLCVHGNEHFGVVRLGRVGMRLKIRSVVACASAISPYCKKQTRSMGIFGWYAAFPKIPGPPDHSVRALLLLANRRAFWLSVVDRHSVQPDSPPGRASWDLALWLLRSDCGVGRCHFFCGFAKSHQGCGIVRFRRRPRAGQSRAGDREGENRCPKCARTHLYATHFGQSFSRGFDRRGATSTGNSDNHRRHACQDH